MQTYIEMFYLFTIEQLFLFVEQLDQLDVCLPDRRLLTGIPILAVFQNSRWNSNKTSLVFSYEYEPSKLKSDLFIFKFAIFRPTFGIMTQLLSLQWKTTDWLPPPSFKLCVWCSTHSEGGFRNGHCRK